MDPRGVPGVGESKSVMSQADIAEASWASTSTGQTHVPPPDAASAPELGFPSVFKRRMMQKKTVTGGDDAGGGSPAPSMVPGRDARGRRVKPARRKKRSLFYRSRHGDEDAAAKATAPGVSAPPSSPQAGAGAGAGGMDGAVAGSGKGDRVVCGIKMSEIQQETDAKLAGMSDAEIQAARAEVLAFLSPEVVAEYTSFMKQRDFASASDGGDATVAGSNGVGGSADAAGTDETKDGSQRVVAAEAPPAPRAEEAPAPRTAEELQAAVAYVTARVATFDSCLGLTPLFVAAPYPRSSVRSWLGPWVVQRRTAAAALCPAVKRT